jgi:hypothetical protein
MVLSKSIHISMPLINFYHYKFYIGTVIIEYFAFVRAVFGLILDVNSFFVDFSSRKLNFKHLLNTMTLMEMVRLVVMSSCVVLETH